MEQTTGKEVRWDLSVMYSGVDDPQIDADISVLREKTEAFSAAHKGRLKENLGQALAEYMEIEILSSKIIVYLSLTQSTDVSNSEGKAKLAQAEKELSVIQGEQLTFFELEIASLPDEHLQKLYETQPLVAKHRPWIEHLRTFKPHYLTEAVESALTKRAPFGPSAWHDFFEEIETDIEVEHGGEKKNLTEMWHLLMNSKVATERTELMDKIHAALGGFFAKYSAQTLYVTTGKMAIENKERGYAHPMRHRNMANRVPDDVVDALHRAVMTTGGELARRYYKLKSKLLDISPLRWSDRNAPLPFADTTNIPFDEAKEMVLKAYGSFSPTLAGLIEDVFRARRVDVPPAKKKRAGAFCLSTILPGDDPAAFVFLNYLGSGRDVMTLAHELGHGVHGILAGKEQGPLMFGAPTAYAETASVFGEMVAFEFLRERVATKGDKLSSLALLCEKIEDSINTVVRQIGLSNFERRIHGMDAQYSVWREPKKMSVEEVGQIWLGTLRELYGPDGDVFVYENADLLWTYIPHFHRPFYVYGYAFGELLTQGLFAQKERLGDKFEPLYLDLLRAGGTKNAVELLEPFGLDPRDPAFWTNGLLMSLGGWIEEAEKLAA